MPLKSSPLYTMPSPTSARPSSPPTVVDARFGASHMGLLRLFESQFFTAWMAVWYLYKYGPTNDGIQQYLCDQLQLKFHVATVIEYLPQLVHLLIAYPNLHHLNALVLHLSHVSPHFALLTLWYLQSYIADLSTSAPDSSQLALCHTLYSNITNIIQGITPASDTGLLNTTTPITPLSADTQIPPATPISATSSDIHPPKTLNDPPPPPAKSTNNLSGIFGSFSNLRSSASSNSPSLEDLHKGRVFSFTHFVHQLTTTSDSSPSSLLVQSPLNVLSASSSNHSITQSTSSGHVSPDSTLLQHYYFHSELQFMGALVSISDRLIAVPREARQSTLTAELTLLNHNFPAPVCLPLWCHATDEVSKQSRHHQIVRISPTDAVVLNSADRVPFLLFIEVIDEASVDQIEESLDEPIPTNLKSHNSSIKGTPLSSSPISPPYSPPNSSMERRPLVRRRSSLSLLPEFLSNSPTSIALPASPACVSEGPESPTQGPVAPFLRKSPSTPAMRNRSVATDLSVNTIVANNSTSTPSILPAPVVPGFISATEFEDRMRTAAVLLAQLAIQDSAKPVLVESPKSNKRSGNPPVVANHTEEIRGRILREMMALEDRRVDALKAWTEATAQKSSASVLESTASSVPHVSPISQPLPIGMSPALTVSTAPASPTSSTTPPWLRRHRQGSVPSQLSKLSSVEIGSISPKAILPVTLLDRDKDDPSSAVVRETWSAKQARIRASSPYGRHPMWALHSVIVKSGADLRQEQLACQLMSELGRVFSTGTGCWLSPYRVLVTGAGHGMIETVRNTVSLHSLKKDAYARVGDHFTLKHYFVCEFGPESSPTYRKAIDCFIASLAGYSIACYVLNIKDRHNGNILLDYTTGHLVHIDFGFMLSNSPGAVAFESAPFKLSHEYVELLDGMGSDRFRDWRNRVVHGFLALRRENEQLVGLVEIMERNSGLDCFAGSASVSIAQAAAVSAPTQVFDRAADVATPAAEPAAAGPAVPQSPTSSASTPGILPVAAAVKDRLLLGMTDMQIADHVDKLIAQSVGNVFTRLYDGYQYYTQGVMA